MIRNVKYKEHQLVSLYWHSSVSFSSIQNTCNQVPLIAMSLGATNYCMQYNRHHLKHSFTVTEGTGYVGEGDHSFLHFNQKTLNTLGMWGSSAGIIAGTLGIVASCSRFAF